MNLFVFSLIVIAVGGTVLFATLRPRKAERVHNTMERWRKTVGAIAGALIAWTLIRSGRPEYIFAAVVMIALATIYIVIEQPHKEVV